MKLLATYDSRIAGNIVASKLRVHDIDVFVTGIEGQVGVNILIREKDFEKAKKVLKEV